MAVFSRIDRIARVTSPYAVAFDDPIVLKAGDVIDVGRHDTEWPDFIWCTTAQGKSGWVAEIVFERHDHTGVVLRDYSAVELQVNEGEVVTIEEAYGGWSWCTNTRGESGWMPDRNLTLI